MSSTNDNNYEAWAGDTYSAWVSRFGTPKEAVVKLRKNPTVVLDPIRGHFGDVAGKHIVNIMGSNGIKALALAMLGADVTIIDYSAGNARYAAELAAQAFLEIGYIISDILSVPMDGLAERFDIAFAELGVVHYFVDLSPFMAVVYRLLTRGGRFVLRDFHPISTKLITSRGSTAKVRKHKITGDYFDTSLEERPVSYAKHLDRDTTEAIPHVLWRKWTLGEIVTAVASTGLRISVLEEEPNPSGFDGLFPKTFTLVAEKA